MSESTDSSATTGGTSTASGASTSAGGTGGMGDTTTGGSGGAIGSGGITTAGGSGGTVVGDTGGTTSTSACGKPGVIFCEDFEAQTAGAFPAAPWTSTGTEGSIVVDAETPAHSGTHSAKVNSEGNYQTFLNLTGAPVFPVTGGALYVRLFMRLSAPMTEGHNTYFKAGAAGAASSNNETRVGVMMQMLMINQPDGDRGFLSNQNYWNDSKLGAVIDKETWACVEAFFDPPSSTVSVALNDTDIPDLHRTDWKQDELGALHFGFEGYAGPSTVLWYDDIVVGTQPIGCD